jgi:TPR repeat protein
MKRLQANDPPAIRKLGGSYYQKGDYRSAAEYFTKAAELGDVESHQLLSVAYHKGQGVEKDEKKNCTIWKWLQSVVIPTLDTILVPMRLDVIGWREQ